MPSEAFAADWLALREAADLRSRAHGLLRPLQAWWENSGANRVLDLGSGTGANIRYLAPRLPGLQHWTLVDRDPALLALAPDVGDPALLPVVSLKRLQGDLSNEGLAAVAGAQLVTASALLDLVSAQWLDKLVGACKRARAAALFALTWDGYASWRLQQRATVDPDDELVIELVRAHQARDKGTGPALGPAAGAAAERAFKAAGYRTWLLPSPWLLGPDEVELIVALIDGWERAAVEQSPSDTARVRSWATRRRADARARVCGVVVGHVDFLALPIEKAKRPYGTIG
jgi:SAM-dependent methyltransferase